MDSIELSEDVFAAFIDLLHENGRHDEAIEHCERRFYSEIRGDKPDIIVGADTVQVDYGEFGGRMSIQHDSRDGHYVRDEAHLIHYPTDTEFEGCDEFAAELATEEVREIREGESMRDAARAAWANSRGVPR